jgi:hypothetical protein
MNKNIVALGKEWITQLPLVLASCLEEPDCNA